MHTHMYTHTHTCTHTCKTARSGLWFLCILHLTYGAEKERVKARVATALFVAKMLPEVE